MSYTVSVGSWVFVFSRKTAYEMRISDWSSDVCSSDLDRQRDRHILRAFVAAAGGHDDHAAVIFARGLGCGIRRVGGGRHIDSGGLEFGGRSGRGRQQQRCSKEKLQAMIGRETVHVIWSPGGVPAPF